MAGATTSSDAVGQALVDFSVRGLFPADDAVATAALSQQTLPDAIRALADAKAQLEAEIHSIVEETADDVRAWTDNAQALQVAIARRKTLATDILLRADEAGTEPLTEEAEARAQFLTQELNYNLQVRYLLEAVRRVSQLLDQVEQAGRGRRILDALRLLERAWAALDAMPVSKSCRAMRLLDLRAFELKADLHAVLDHVWAALVRVDVDVDVDATLTISMSRSDEPMSLADAVVGFQAYKEVDQRMAALWQALDTAIVGPRTDLANQRRPAIYVEQSTLAARGTAEDGVDALFRDLEQLFAFLAAHLPPALLHAISAPSSSSSSSSSMMSTLSPASSTSGSLHRPRPPPGLDRECAPCLARAAREAALDTVRSDIAKGLGTPQQIEKIERQMVSRSEGKELAAATTTGALGGAGANPPEQSEDWDTAWSDEEAHDTKGGEAAGDEGDDGDDGADAWAAWGDDDDNEAAAADTPAEEGAEEPPQALEPPQTPEPQAPQDDDDAADAWGWGDDGGNDAPESETAAAAKPRAAEPQTRELVLKEKYYISSLPAPVLALITQVLEDGVALTSGEYAGSSVATAAAGLFGLPALVLAMFRAVSPHYYALDVGGSMYLYNDAMYLAEQLAGMVATWTERLKSDSSSSAPISRIGAEIDKLQAFASRAYGKEMAVQKTVLRDLLGGDQNVLQGSAGNSRYSFQDQDEDADDYVDAAVARVRSMAAAWEGVLAPSAWAQAVGALADAVAQKLIVDVLDMPSISQDEAFALAQLIQKVTELDDLFLEGGSAGGNDGGNVDDRVPLTAQYAGNWLRLQYLSEVLQSNLREVRFLWMESELSLYFTADEVVDLMRLSFEDNARSREVAREIAANPHPVHP